MRTGLYVNVVLSLLLAGALDLTMGDFRRGTIGIGVALVNLAVFFWPEG